MAARPGTYRFGRFELRPATRQFLVDDEPAPLGARAFDVLQALIERRDRLVAKNELLEVAWPGLVVEENNLQVQISALRKLVGPQIIATVPGRGYRFNASLDDAVGDAGAPMPASVAVTGHAPRASQTNLPVELPTLYGRDEDLAALLALLDAHRLVTVVGAGGIGKSRLAQAAAHAVAGRWPDGAWMVELAGLSDPALLPNAVAQALDIAVSGTGAVQDKVATDLATRTLLLVLDNCEHVLDAAASLANAILARAPGVKLLATSQEPLHLSDEQQFRVMPLAIPAATSARDGRGFGAVALFEARVRAADPRFALNDEDLAVVIDICRRLDGLPLAIELAAARVTTLGLRPLRDKLDARFKLLTGGARATLRRHQTLRAALEWSHNLLDDGERAVFRRLGVFAGGFRLDVAQRVCEDEHLDEWAVLDHLSALVDKSLVVADPGDTPRYRLLESTRAFALEQLAAGETAETLKRHALAMRDFLRRIDDANLDGELRTDQYAALMLPELDNLRAAYAWATGEPGDPEVATSLAAHAGPLIDHGFECADWLISRKQQVEEGRVEAAVAARYWRALAAGNMVGQVSLTLQKEAARRAVRMYRALDQPRRVFSSLIQLSRDLDAQQESAATQAVLDEARSLIRPEWPVEHHITLMRRQIWHARARGRNAEALALDREAVRLAAASGDWRLETIAKIGLIDLLWEMGPIDVAAREAQALAEALRARPAAFGETENLYANWLGILSEMGRIDEAATVAAEHLSLMRRARTINIEAWAHFFWRRNQLDASLRLMGASAAHFARMGRSPQNNEQRMLAQVRSEIAKRLPPDAIEMGLAAGAALGRSELLALITETLAQPWGSPPGPSTAAPRAR